MVLKMGQSTNRDPVMALTEMEIEGGIERLRAKNLAHTVTGGGARAQKYGQTLDRHLGLTVPQKAALCVLMLRGPQTIGEIRGRTDRMHRFASTVEVEEILGTLTSHPKGQFVVRLEREPGQKEPRYAQILSGLAEHDPPSAHTPSLPPSALGEDQVTRLENRLDRLEGEMEELRRMFAEFRKQFE